LALGSAIPTLRPDARALCKRIWWVFLLGGIASLLFGIVAIAAPGLALLVIALFFAATVLVDGVFNVVGALRNREKDGWWIVALIGLLGVVVGGAALLLPEVTMLVLVYLVAIQAILLGAFLLMLGYQLRKAIEREWILYLTGALSIVLGILIFARPVVGGLSIVAFIAAWAIVTGLLRIWFAFKVRRLPDARRGLSALR
jgi:uncharacterized membrane protein HdeD (DUF308 family)